MSNLRSLLLCLAGICVLMASLMATTTARSAEAAADGAVVKARLTVDARSQNLLRLERFQRYERGFERDGEMLVCDNGVDATARRGATQGIVLNQSQPEPIVAAAWSKAEGVSGGRDSNYAVYLDLVYQDGTSLWGQTAPFSPGTHDWQRRQVVVMPEKAVKSISFYMLLRGHAGKAWFREPVLSVIHAPAGSTLFDGVPVVLNNRPSAGFQVRDVAADSGFVRLEHAALGLKLESQRSQHAGATFIDATLSDTSGRDRAVTLIYSQPIGEKAVRWLADPRRSEPAVGREFVWSSQFHAGANGRLSRYPLAAVAGASATGQALGIDLAHPAVFRVGFNPAAGELFLAYDLGLTAEKPSAHVRFCQWSFDAAWGFRAALAAYYQLFPEQFRCRTPEQGLWMPFAKISKVDGWEDFGFKFKEGNDETAWDDAHGITTFRYTEPMTWWMRMPKETPRTMAAALTEAQRLARDKHDPMARALLSSGYHNESGEFAARLLDTPWCNGAVWSMNSMPGIAGDVTHFKFQWNPQLRETLYGPARRGDLDGEYIDSAEGYVTDELDFRREHFATADSPLCFAPETNRPAIFRGLVAFEYVRGIANDVHGMGKLMMANGCPGQLPWLVPLVDVGGTETDWHRQGHWRPMSDAELLYRRALCRGKPYCFLMNTNFDEFSHELVEKYMRRSLAYGMFPGFFSHNASEKAYFTQPALYNRDRPLFKKYVPVCKLVAAAGWEPVTQARCSDERVYVERFGRRYLTVFNDSPDRRTVTLTLETAAPAASRDLLSGRPVAWTAGKTGVTLDGEDVAVIDLGP